MSEIIRFLCLISNIYFYSLTSVNIIYLWFIGTLKMKTFLFIVPCWIRHCKGKQLTTPNISGFWCWHPQRSSQTKLQNCLESASPIARLCGSSSVEQQLTLWSLIIVSCILWNWKWDIHIDHGAKFKWYVYLKHFKTEHWILTLDFLI